MSAPSCWRARDLVREAEPHARGDDHHRLAHFATLLGDPAADRNARVTAGLAPELQALMLAHGQPYGLTRAEGEFPIRADRREARLRRLVRVLSPLRHLRSRQARHLSRRGASPAPDRVALGFDVVYLPPIHPIGRTHRKGPNNALVAGSRRPGEPLGHRQRGRRPHRGASRAWAPWRTFAASWRPPGRWAWRSRWTTPSSARPTIPGCGSIPTGSSSGPTGPSSTPRTRPRSTRTSTRSTSGATERQALWDACRDIFLFWIAQGVRTFRVDNPHTKPFAFWEWVIAEVQREHPDTVFLAEAFTRPKRMQALARLGFTQSYTYFTWRNTAAELTEYLTELTGAGDGGLSSGATSSPTRPTSSTSISSRAVGRRSGPGCSSPAHCRRSTASTAASSSSENVPVREGSEEYLDSEKYQVRVRDWGAPGQSRCRDRPAQPASAGASPPCSASPT